MSVTKAEVRNALRVTMAVAESIREADTGDGVPAGPLYASLMASTGISYEGWESLLRNLKNAGLIRATATTLFWTGPAVNEN